jgi:hypothetical protein
MDFLIELHSSSLFALDILALISYCSSIILSLDSNSICEFSSIPSSIYYNICFTELIYSSATPQSIALYFFPLSLRLSTISVGFLSLELIFMNCNYTLMRQLFIFNWSSFSKSYESICCKLITSLVDIFC